MQLKIISIVGNRPQLIKLYPIIRAIRKPIKHIIIHTGQHYDFDLDEIFFENLEIPNPDYNLQIGSGSHCEQIGKGIRRIEKALIKEKPDWVLVYGDTNSTLAGALSSAKLHIPVAHIEAGLRSYDENMPEELNRKLTDMCSSVLFCPTGIAIKNLKREGIDSNVINTGDVMHDALILAMRKVGTKILNTLKIKRKSYYLVTIHREENIDNKSKFKEIIDALIEINKHETVVFPIHPRTRMALRECRPNKLHCISPVGYFDMLALVRNAKKVLTDSGGLQKEAYLLKIPCVTIRENTEWPETLRGKWNILTGINRQKIIEATLVDNHNSSLYSPELFGDGTAAYKIIDFLIRQK